MDRSGDTKANHKQNEKLERSAEKLGGFLGSRVAQKEKDRLAPFLRTFHPIAWTLNPDELHDRKALDRFVVYGGIQRFICGFSARLWKRARRRGRCNLELS
jgi:hypothetical protein